MNPTVTNTEADCEIMKNENTLLKHLNKELKKQMNYFGM